MIIFELGPRPTKRDVGNINFWAVNVAAQVAASSPRRPGFAGGIMVDDRRHGPVRTGAA